jgi:hypothetical protein
MTDPHTEASPPVGFDTSRFLEFCRGWPASEPYNPYSASKCALAQFGFVGVQYDNLGDVPESVFFRATEGPFTFGALADRLEAILTDQVRV